VFIKGQADFVNAMVKQIAMSGNRSFSQIFNQHFNSMSTQTSADREVRNAVFREVKNTLREVHNRERVSYGGGSGGNMSNANKDIGHSR